MACHFNLRQCDARELLWAIVFALAVIVAYALSASLHDVWMALIFGVVGFFARRHGFTLAPIAADLIVLSP